MPCPSGWHTLSQSSGQYCGWSSCSSSQTIYKKTNYISYDCINPNNGDRTSVTDTWDVDNNCCTH